MKDELPHSAFLNELENGKAYSDLKIDRLNEETKFEVVQKISAIQDSKFALQYNSAYNARLWLLKPVLQEKFEVEWKPQNIVLKLISELCEGSQSADQKRKSLSPAKGNKVLAGHEQRVAFHEDVLVAIIGTIFKHQPEKPSILLELNEDNPIVPVVPKEKYTSDKDYLMLEDETTVVRLIPTKGCGIEVSEVVNGVVCAVKGRPTHDGKFEVSEVLWATPKPATWPKLPALTKVEMVFVSGLQLGREIESDKSIAMELLFDYLMGLGGSTFEQETKNSKQKKVFFIGNHLYKSCRSFMDSLNPKMIENALKFDAIVEGIAATTEVFVLPGTDDAAHAMLPQPPIHKSMMPKSYCHKSFHSLPNPCELKLEISPETSQIDIVLSSGENVVDALRNCEIDSALEMAQKLLQWGHLCPTAPDTLALHPGASGSSFILPSTLPHMYVVGNQRSFDSREWMGTKIVSVPSFWETATVVLLTEELEFVPLSFNTI